MIERPYVLGVDVGGTKIAAAVVAPDGAIGSLTQVETPADQGPGAIVGAALDATRTAVARSPYPVVACGIGTAGTVGRGGVITHATDVLRGWTGTNLKQAFGDALGIPVVVLNDVHATSIGEGTYGAAAGFTDALVVAIGTGIGGGLLHDGVLFPGGSGSAGSIGHMPVDAASPRRCSCGKWNHLEAHAAGPAIEARYAEVTGLSIRLPEIAARARTGEDPAASVIAEAAAILGRALGGAVNLLDPDVVVISGGVAAIEDLLAEPIRRALAGEVLPGPGRVEVRYTTLGTTAAILGAGMMARELYKQQGSTTLAPGCGEP